MRGSNFLVTGAARGIGRGLSRLLLERGHRVMMLDSNREELDHIAEVLQGRSRQKIDFHVFGCDVGDATQVKEAVEQAHVAFGGHLDCLVNNAAYTGGVGGPSLEDMTLEEWNRSLQTNLTGPMLVTQACLPMLRQARGCVINMSSTRAAMSEPDNEAYATTKAGLLGLTQSMAVSLARDRIRVNAVVPGWIHVADESKAADEAGTTWAEGLSPADHRWHLTGRVGKVDDILRAVEYLCDSDGVSGVEMVVDGGVTRKMVYPEDEEP